MYGEPKDVEGECNAHLYIADDYGDNRATIRCQLPKGHDGEHREVFERGSSGEVVIRWQKDERCYHEWIERTVELEHTDPYVVHECKHCGTPNPDKY